MAAFRPTIPSSARRARCRKSGPMVTAVPRAWSSTARPGSCGKPRWASAAATRSTCCLPGRNYGWPLTSKGLKYDGTPVDYGKELGITFDLKDIVQPVVDLTPAPAVSSFVFYEGGAFRKWRGDMLVGTLKATELYRMVVKGDRVVHRETLLRGPGPHPRRRGRARRSGLPAAGTPVRQPDPAARAGEVKREFAGLQLQPRRQHMRNRIIAGLVLAVALGGAGVCRFALRRQVDRHRRRAHRPRFRDRHGEQDRRRLCDHREAGQPGAGAARGRAGP